jgi:O-acetyl-ADP-ribose deacetylase (regulator of RNase III)
VCNDVGGWGAGFVLALSRRWEEPERAYRRWHREHPADFALGEIHLIEVEAQLWVANLLGQRDVRRGPNGEPPVRYDAIRSGLERVARFALDEGATVHMPRIGAGLAGGSWPVIEAIVVETLVDAGIDVTVYDLPS